MALEPLCGDTPNDQTLAMPFFDHDGLNFHYLDNGSGAPFIFQHGLGANVRQPEELYRPQPGFRFVSVDCRGHGETRPLGDPNKLSFITFAGDLLALMNMLMLSRAIVGGISMGAGLALNFGVRFPERTLGLIFSRPAWLDCPMPENLYPLTVVASFIRQYGAQAGLEHFKQSDDYHTIRRLSPDSADSLVGRFTEPRAEEAVARLEKLPNDVPHPQRDAWTSIKVPTLILATRMDPIHPFEYAETLAHAIPGAILKELTPKSVSRERYRLETQEYIGNFLQEFFAY
jgi:pimeloyl-ACP methyl ester carboxylesterase